MWYINDSLSERQSEHYIHYKWEYPMIVEIIWGILGILCIMMIAPIVYDVYKDWVFGK